MHLGGGRGKSKALSVALLGFNKVHEDFKLNDKEGVDFREQLISMRNNIYERLDAHIDHQDEKIDFRDSFKSALKTVKWSNI